MTPSSTQNAPTTQPTTQPYIDTRPPLRRQRPPAMQAMQQRVIEMQRHAVGSPERTRLESDFVRQYQTFAYAQTIRFRCEEFDDELDAAVLSALAMATRSWRPGGKPFDCFARRACRWAAGRALEHSRLVRSKRFRSGRDLVSIVPGETSHANEVSEESFTVAVDDSDDKEMQRRLNAWDSLPANQQRALQEEYGQRKQTMSDVKRKALVALAMLRLGGGKI